MRAILKDARMREQAGRIQLEVEALLNDVRLLDDRAEKLQKHFGQAEEDVRKLRISAERIAQKGEKIRDVELDEDEEKKPLGPPAAT
jgi:DNA recombination protein RmuC